MVERDEQQYDLFVFHADSDRAWVEGYLLDALSQAGVRYITEAAFTLGVPRLIEFERATRQSRHTLLILSQAYVGGQLSQFVDVLAQSYGLETTTWPVVPLILDHVEVPSRLAMLVPLDATIPAEWPHIMERLCEFLKCSAPRPALKPSCPYPGMVPFAEADAGCFFGRDSEIRELLESLRLHPFLTVIGPSGSGKSSLVFAGLVPALRRSGLFGPGEWTVRSMRPGEAPLATLQATVGDLIDLQKYAPSVESSLRLLLVVDQMEELFALHPKDATAFQQSLLRLAEVQNCYVVLTARADFYAELMASPLWPAVQAHRFEVTPLEADGLRQAIIRPAEDVDVYVEAALVERLVADAEGEPGALPFVQETLKLLWERLERRFLPLRAYQSLILARSAYGAPPRTGLQVAMARRGDATLAELTAAQQVTARRILLRLVQFGEGRADTRRQQPLAALHSMGDDPAAFDVTLNALVDSRLVTLSGGQTGDTDRRADIAHEALIAGWPTLAGWVTERRGAEQIRRRLEEKTNQWRDMGSRTGGLLDAFELREAECWLTSSDATDLGYDATLPALVLASRHALRRAWWLRIGTISIAVLAVIAIIASVAIQQAKAAEQARFQLQQEKAAAEREATLRREAEAQLLVSRSLQVAAAARNLLENGQSQQALLLAIAATREITETAESDTVLRDALDAWRGEGSLPGHTARISQLIYSPNGQYLASIDDGGTVRLWQMAGKRLLLVLPLAKDVLTKAHFSPDSRWLVVSSRDGAVRVLDVVSGRAVHMLKHGSPVSTVAISPNGQWIASGGEDSRVRLWDLITGQPDRIFQTGGSVQDVVFSPDSRLLIAASSDTNTWLWNLIEGGQVQLSVRETDPHTVDGLAWSPDGHYLAARAGDAFRVWDVWDNLKEVKLKQAQNSGEINGMVFSWDSRFMATGCQDGAARIWDMQRTEVDPLILRGHTRSIWSITFTYDNRLLVSTGWDKQIRLWRADDGALQAILTGHTAEVWSPALSPDGRILATADSSGALRLWRIQGGGDTAHFVALSQPVTAMAMAGSEVVLAGGDGTIEVRQPRIDATRFYTAGDLRLESIAVSPDLGLLAAGSADGQIILLDAASGARLAAWPAHDGSVRGLSFLPDGIHLASGGTDRIIRLWDLRRQQAGIGQATLEMRGHENDVTALEAIRDSYVLVSAGADGTVRFWDWRTGRQSTELAADGPLLAIAVSPDKQYLASGGQGAAVQVWNVANELTPENRGGAARVGAASTREVVSLHHGVPVRALTFGANTSELLTGAEDGNLRLWTITETGSGTPTVIHAHGDRWVIGLGLADNGESIYSAGGDGQVRVWPVRTKAVLALACNQVGRNLSREEWQTYLSFRAFEQLCPDSEIALWQVTEQLDPPQARPLSGVARATADERPIIRYFEAVPGATMAAGENILLRWDTSNATEVHLEYDGERHGVSSPHEERISPATDKVYRLIAENNLGERTIAIKVSVER